MQQRYCDPMIGRCLSVDPVTVYDNGDTRFFNRYAYAFNNPYAFKDPDGRCPTCDRFSDNYAQAVQQGRQDEFKAFVPPAAGTMAVMAGVPVAVVAYTYRGAIITSVAMFGNPVHTLDALEEIAARRELAAKIAEQSKQVSEIANKIKKLLSAIIVTTGQPKPLKQNQEPPPDTSHKPPPPPPPPPPPDKKENLE